MAIDVHANYLNQLEVSARTSDRGAFADIVESINWSVHSPDELLRVIDLTLSVELADLAIRLAQEGGRLFPDHERMQQAAKVLAPPMVSARHIPKAEGLDDSAAWLHIHANEYRGQWVAVRKGQFLGTARTLQELAAIVEQDPLSTLVTKVL